MAEPSTEAQDAAAYLLSQYKGGRTPRERTVRLNATASDPLDLLRDIRLDVSIDGNKVGARMVHEPTGTTVEAPGLGVALVNALRACVAAVEDGRMTEPATFEQIEAPQRAAAEQATQRARDYLAEDEAQARAASERNGQNWWCPSGGLLDLNEDDQAAQDVDQIVVYDSDVAEHMARHDPRRVLAQCGSLGDVLTDLERIAERSPDPDSRMWARGAIHTLARVWEPDDEDVAGKAHG